MQALGGLLVREEDVLDDVQSEYLLLQLLLVAVELLLFRRDLSSEHGLATPLLFTGEFLVFELEALGSFSAVFRAASAWSVPWAKMMKK